MSHQKNIKKKEHELKELEVKSSATYMQLKKMRRRTKLLVTDHAIVRYQERVEFLPASLIQEKLINAQVLNYYYSLGDGTYPIGESSIRVVIKEGVIVTVMI